MIAVDKEDILKLKAELESRFTGSVWFKGIELAADDGGSHLDFRITSVDGVLADGVTFPVVKPGRIKICYISVGEPSGDA